jgi:hypothetical protein
MSCLLRLADFERCTFFVLRSSLEIYGVDPTGG